MLLIYNSLTRRKEAFKPLLPGKIGIYVCGITVYDYCHLGHARLLVCFDLITRYLRSRGFEVWYIRNITDIDDKIINRASEKGEAVEDLTTRFIDAMHDDEQALLNLPPDEEPRATGHIDEIINLIQTLCDKDHAYVGENGDVFYDVLRFDNYGALSHKDIAGLQAGARVEVEEAKRNPLDFVLWKQAKPDEPQWDSPWGVGRPGWHIECSAMSMKCLGENFDIHGGGFDLQFPHNENEIAQSEAATGKPFANLWMHVGFLQINREKMSKSLGNFFTIREVLKEFSPEVVRYFLISSHYRSQLNYALDNLTLAHSALERLYTALRGFDLSDTGSAIENEFTERFNAAMDDDFNTPEALAVLFDLTHTINTSRQTAPDEALTYAQQLKQLGAIFGILQQPPETFLQSGIAADKVADIEKLIKAREQARQDRDWAKADEIRNQLTKLQVELEDTPEGTIWRAKE